MNQGPNVIAGSAHTAARGVAVVAIGRNEGDRLRRCLNSINGGVETVIYVDSGSTDGSPELARTFNAIVVPLDMTRPFTAARARNAGLRKAIEDPANVRYVQFIDGDCEIEEGWIEAARAHMEIYPRVAAVFGRRRERHPEDTIFNQLCDIEWNVPPGSVKACGGDVMMRVTAITEAGGYRDTMIAGEEPELCVRLRQAGWSIECLPRAMTIHDAAMTKLGQWWRRSLRSGHAFAEGAAIHGAAPEYHNKRECYRILAWGAALPTVILTGTALFSPWSAFLGLVYPVQVVRLARKERSRMKTPWLWSFFTVASNFPSMLGILKYRLDRLRGTGGVLIEYK